MDTDVRLSFIRMLVAVLALCATAMSGAAQQGSAGFNPITFELAFAAADSSADRRALLEEAITQINATPDPDLATFFDLNLMLLDVLEANGEVAAASTRAALLAQFALRQGAEFGISPLPHLARAVRLAEAAGNYQLLIDLRNAEFVYLRDSGQDGAQLAEFWDNTAALAARMGQTDEVERLRAEAEALRAEAPNSEMQALGAPAPGSGTRSVGSDGGFREVEVFYATDRARSGNTAPSEFYGGDRGELEYGSLIVTIPDSHQPGQIEAPSIWRLEFTENPAKHVVLQSVTPLPVDGFFGKMQAEMTSRDRKEAFVFIHGFNVRFDAAAKRAAQLAYDMKYRGVPVLYSWPSAGRTVSYVADTAVVRLSGRRLAQFLEDLRARSGADVIHIVAHSMGNRALTDALELLAARQSGGEVEEPLFGQIFFAAPDVDAGLFAEMTKSIRPIAERLTLYTSSEDWALVTSRTLHGNAPRAGQAGDTLLSEPHLDTIDMSKLGEDMLAHSYFANDSSALVDIMALLWRNADPERRCGLMPARASITGAATAWVYEQNQCDVQMIMDLIASAWQERDVDIAQIQTLIQQYVSDPEDARAVEQRFLAILGRD